MKMMKMNKKKIIHKGEEVIFSISKNKLSKRLKLSINVDGEVKVSIPLWVSSSVAEHFVKERIDWIVDNLKRIKERAGDSRLRLGERDYIKNKEKARRFITDRVNLYNQFYGFKIGIIAIRNQKTRWGSCSRKSNLNFNYKLFFLPLELADYVIVHEICHLKEMNHSERFWKLIEKVFPDYRERRRNLKKYKI